MPTIYLDECGAVLRKEHHTLRVEKEGLLLAELPLDDVEAVVVAEHASLTSAAMEALLVRGVDTCFISRHGRLLGRLQSSVSKNAPLRVVQYQRSLEPEFCLGVGRAVVATKVSNQRTLLLRQNRDIGHPEVSSAAERMEQLARSSARPAEPASLLGLEGSAARECFAAFTHLLKPPMGFDGRERRPPTDPVNALLSFAYALLENLVEAAVWVVGLDPFVGFYHRLEYGRPSLVLDLMEEFRPVVADSVVLSLVNNQRVTQADFVQEGEAVLLTENGRRALFEEFERRISTQIFHPDIGSSIPFPRVAEAQARRMAKAIQGQLPAYRPFEVR